MNIRQIRKYIVVVGSLALVTIFLAACVPITPVAAPPAADAAATPAPAGESAAPTLEGVVWDLASYRDESGAQVEATAPASIALEAGSLSGSAGCNRLFASYVVDGSQLTIEPGGSSMMMCDEAVMAQEAAVLANLGTVASYTIDDAGQLNLLDADGNVVLSFTEQVAPSLTGVVWEATNYNNGREAVVGVLEGTKITALFGEDGMLSGSAGCNNYVTGFAVDGNSLTIEPAASTMMLCAEPEGVMEQESAYLAALSTAATYSIRDGMLEMRTADDAMVALYVVSTDEEPANPEAEASADPDPVVATADAPAVDLAETSTPAATGVVTAPLGVNVRTGPGTQYAILGIAPLGTEGEIVGVSEDGDWWVASVPAAPDGIGWVAAAYVTATGADDAVVFPTPPLPEPQAAVDAGTGYAVAQNTILLSASRVVQEGNRVYELEDIYTVDATPGSQLKLVARNAMQPALSPDRSTLAYRSMQADMLGIGGYDVATGQRLRFSGFVEDSSPRWSPSGGQIVFASNRQGDRRWRVYITDAVNKTNPNDMSYVELGFGKDPDWHPSQDLIIFKGCDDQGQNCGTYTMNLDGSGRTQFTDNATDSMPRYFPDGSAVVFMSERDGNWDLYRAGTADGAVTRLTDDPAPDGLPAVSPDGQQIAFISKRGGSWGVWTLPAAGGAATQVGAIPGELPSWLLQAVDWPK